MRVLMLNQRSLTLLFAVAIFTHVACFANSRPQQTVSFNQDWRFRLGDFAGAQDAGFDDSQWRQLDLPHDWSIEGNFSEQNPAGTGGGALPGGVGWDRKTFAVPTTAKGKLIFVEFDGVYRNSEVWINGHYLGKRPYRYSGFEYELTPYLVYGARRNVIAVKVDNSQQPNSRWYSGSGIYRNVWLTTLDPVHVEHWGTYVTTPEVSEQSATISIKTKVSNGSNSDAQVRLTTMLQDASGRNVVYAVENATAAKGAHAEVSQTLKISTPMLWSDERPYVYKIIS